MSSLFSTILRSALRAVPKTRLRSAVDTMARKTVQRVLTPPDPIAVALIDQLFTGLALPDEAQRLQAVMQVVHRSMLFQDKTGTTLDRTIREFSYPRAVSEMGLYEHPVRVTEVQRGQTMITIGTGPTAERGRTDKYFIAKRSGVAGRPAPISVFFPEAGGAPSIVNFGSL